MGKSWGKNSQKSTENYTNVCYAKNPKGVKIPVKPPDFTKVHKPVG